MKLKHLILGGAVVAFATVAFAQGMQNLGTLQATDQLDVSRVGAATVTYTTPADIKTYVNTGAQTITGAITAQSTLAVTGAITPTGGVAAAGGFSISPRNIATCGLPPSASTSGTDQTPVATEVYIAEVFIPANVTLTGVALMNGSVASGNLKVGLANSAGAVVATSASTAMSGTDAFQRIPFTATYAAKGPATYYVLSFVDNTTARLNALPFGNCGAAKQTGQTFATGFTTITPPTTFTADLGPIAVLY